MTAPDDFCGMEPGSEAFLPAKYTLRICDTKDRQGHILYYQASSPFPLMSVGNLLKTVSWPLGYAGRLCICRRGSSQRVQCWRSGVLRDIHLLPFSGLYAAIESRLIM